MPRTKGKNNKSNLPATGRPSSYREEYVTQAFEATRWGMDLPGLARLFGVSLATIHNWKKGHSEFLDAIKRGRYEHDTQKVTSSLLEKAMGYEWDEVTEEGIVLIADDGTKKWFVEKTEVVGRNGKKRTIKTLVEGRKIRVTHKKIAPDTMAIMYWLQNRNPEEWKNVQKQEVITTGRVDHTHRIEHDLKHLERGELERLQNILAEAHRRRPSNDGGSGERPGPGLARSLHPPMLASGRD